MRLSEKMLLILEYARQKKLFHKKRFKMYVKFISSKKKHNKHKNVCDILARAVFSARLVNQLVDS